MKNTNKSFTTLCSVLACMLFSGTANLMYAQQKEQSDYEVTQQYQKEYQSLSNKVGEAGTSADMEMLITSIKKFQEHFNPHKELLNKVIYPQHFDDQLTALKKNAFTTKQRLATIEQQNSKLRQLNGKLSGYTHQLDKLNQKTDSLQLAMQKSIKSEKQLSSLVRAYRESLQKRDDLILSFVDSVMIAYQKLDINSIQDLENAQKKARFNADGNALSMIKNIARENVDFLKSNPKLSTEEYLRMNAVQHQFNRMWTKIGARLTEVYTNADNRTQKKTVDEAIALWNNLVSSKTWTALNEAIHKEGIDLPKFTGQDAFYGTLNDYLETSFNASKKDRTQKTYTHYQKFYSLWTNEVQLQWAPYFEQGNILTNKQIASIDRKVDQWASIAKPQSNVLLYLFGGSLLAVVVLGVFLIREKTK